MAAFEVLRGGGVATRRVDEVARERGLDARDRGLLRRIVTTEVRRRGTLHALVRHFARGRPNRELATLLRIGLVQLFFLDQIPDHAAVSETVRATTDTQGVAKGKYANAVLRAALAERREGSCGDPRRDLVGRDLHVDAPVFADPEEHPLLWGEDALSMPAAILKPWSRRWGMERAFELARAALEAPPLSLRVVSGDRDAVAAELAAHDVETRPGAHPAVLLAGPRATEAVLESGAFRAGRLTIQGETALRAAELAAAREGERWLDLCAAPGGKTAVLAGAGASVVACDVSEPKLALLRSTVARLGLERRCELVRVGGEVPAPEGPFDGALVDVPCSNTGVLAQRPEARWSYGPQRRAALAELQERLLAEAAARVRPGGRLVYSTCSIEPAENERRVAAFLDARPEWRTVAEHSATPDPWSAAGPVDGGYSACLEREA